MTNNDAIALIKDMELEVKMAKKGMLSNFYLMDQNKMLDMLEQLREQLPNDIKRAQTMLIEKKRILEEAKQSAENMLLESEAKARQLVENANDHANRLVDDAEAEAAARVHEAEEYAQRITKEAELQASQMIAQEHVVQEAQAQAQEILDSARQESAKSLDNASQQAGRIYYNALDSAEQIMIDTEKYLDSKANELRRMRAELQQPTNPL